MQSGEAARRPGWFRRDCHMHSSRSTGADLTPDQLIAAARGAGLDFIAITEHNTVEGHGEWGPYAGGDLEVILGQEVVPSGGHWLALGIPAGGTTAAELLVLPNRHAVQLGVRSDSGDLTRTRQPLTG